MFQSLNLEVEKAKAIEKQDKKKRLENTHLKSLKRYTPISSYGLFKNYKNLK